MELHPVGVSGVLAVLGDAISEETGARVAALREAVLRAQIPGVTESVPAPTARPTSSFPAGEGGSRTSGTWA